MNTWSPEFPGRLVDFPDYCRMVERAQEKTPNSVFAYEPMFQDHEGRIRATNRIVIAEWVDKRDQTFRVLLNGGLGPDGVEGLRTYAQLETDYRAAHIIAEHLGRVGREAERASLSRKIEADARRREFGRDVLRKSPNSQIARRMATGMTNHRIVG